MYEALIGGSIDPIDGSVGSFLGTMRFRLRLAVKEIPERTIYSAAQESSRRMLEDEESTLTRATLTSMLAENAKEFPTRAYVSRTST